LEHNASAGGWKSRLADWFPDREFFMRSQGQVRFIKISSRLQKIAAIVVVAALAAWAVSMAVMAWNQYRAQADRDSLLERVAEVASTEKRQAAYADDIEQTTAELVKRQEFLEAMTPLLPDDIQEGDTVSDSTAESARTVSEVSARIPEAAGLGRLEARQLAYVERLTRYADRRAARASIAIRKLGLNPEAIARNTDRSAMGGPLEILATGPDGKVDPRFERLGLSMARMDALERGLDGIPQFVPASVAKISSGFGYRRDPFNGGGAMHSGLDFKGPRGAPIHAAAKGVVSHVGWKSGYGKTVEIKHGNGLMTRYAHMSKFNAAVGQEVAAGDIIGGIGSTGRSTGPHLHFEVRINDRAVNPRPFLEKAPNVLKEARASANSPSQQKDGG
jgi:murein DD-endopeptidase MepM/ murein hydrolase activator NlpD